MTVQSYMIADKLRDFCCEFDIPAARLLARAGLATDLGIHDLQAVDRKLFLRLLKAMQAEIGGQQIPLTAVRTIAKTLSSPACIAFAASSDVKTGFERMAKLKPLEIPGQLLLEWHDEALKISFRLDTDEAQPVSILLFELAFFLELIRLHTGIWVVPVKVSLPAHMQLDKAYQDFFVTPIEIGDAATLAISSHDANLPLISGERIAAIEPKSDIVQSDLRRRLESVLSERLPSGQVQIAEIAPTLHMSVRSLQRSLNEANLSYRHILDDLRLRISTQYLAQGEFSIAEIAYLLGYSEPSVFFRAYKRWTGRTPKAKR